MLSKIGPKSSGTMSGSIHHPRNQSPVNIFLETKPKLIKFISFSILICKGKHLLKWCPCVFVIVSLDCYLYLHLILTDVSQIQTVLCHKLLTNGHQLL